MASAIFTAPNELHWPDQKAYTRRSLGPANPMSDFDHNAYCLEEVKCVSDSIDDRKERETRVISEDSTSENLGLISFGDQRTVTFNIASYSKQQRKDLKQQLAMELDQVRTLMNRIESEGFYFRSSSHASAEHETSAVHFSPLVRGSDNQDEVRMLENRSSVGAPVSKHASMANNFLRSAGLESKKEKLLSGVMKRCWQILMKLRRQKDSWIFLNPVDPVKEGLHDYFQIIRQPMDLGTVKNKFEKNLYMSPMEFASDVRLTFRNALMYNPKGHHVNSWAAKLLGLFEEMFGPAYKNYQVQQKILSEEEIDLCPFLISPPEGAKKRKLSATGASARMEIAGHMEHQDQEIRPACMPAVGKPVIAKQRRSKPKDPCKRVMSNEEKQQLSLNLQMLPEESMNQVVQIIRKRNTNLEQQGDEIEIDIDTIDAETLWELHCFVSDVAKSAIKPQKQDTGVDHVINTIEASAEDKTTAIGVSDPVKNRKNEAGDEDIDIGEEAPSSNFPPVEIEKDCSSSSSSSDSSSSDSSSRSSSGSDSDTDDAQFPAAGG